MQRLFLAAALLAVSCQNALPADDKKEEKKDEKAGFPALRAEFIKKFRAAEDEEGKLKALKEYGPKFMEMAEKGGKSKEAFGATVFALQIGSLSKNPAMKAKAVALLKKNHLASEELGGALSVVAGAMGDQSGPFFKELMEKGANDKIKKAATLALIDDLEGRLLSADPKKSAAIRKELADLTKVAVKKYEAKDLFVGSKLPDLKSENLAGKEEKLSQYKGKVVVLDIWATWCPPCRAMIPHERELVERMKDKPFALISVSFDEEKDTLKDFLKKEKMPWTHWWNGRKGEIGDQLSIRAFPTIFVLDGKGVIRFKGTRGKSMDKAVEILLKEMEDGKKSS